MTLEVPPENVWTGGRWKTRNLLTPTRVDRAVFMVVTGAALMVPSVSYWVELSGARNVRPFKRRLLTMIDVPHCTKVPVPAAYEPPPVAVTVAAVPPTQPPVSWPELSEIWSPAEGMDQVIPAGNSALIAVKNVPRFVVTSSAASV
jgi:hypothetical protein